MKTTLIKLTSKERLFLVKLLNNSKWVKHGEKPMGITNQMHVDVLLHKLKKSQRINTLK